MEYINAEQFLNADKKVQEAILEWWNPEIGDIYCNLYNGQKDNVLVINKCQFNFKTFKEDIKKYGCPFLTEGQLIKFIKNKSCKIRLIEDDIKTLNIVLFNGKVFKFKEKDLLQSLWKMVCKIILE